MRRNSLRFMVILATLLIVILFLNFNDMAEYLNFHNTSDIAEHLNNAAFESHHTTSKVTHFEVSSNTPSINNRHTRNSPPVAKGNVTKTACKEISKLYFTYARSKHLSDYDMDCLLEHYEINGLHYLDKASKLRFFKCNPDYTRYGYKGPFKDYLNVKPTDLGSCTKLADMHFINGTRVITLVSFPGSGNTWTRLLLEQVTGIFTGSIFCDEDLRSSGFFGEHIISSNVLAVKTHFPGAGKLNREFTNPAHVDGVIFIMRNPLDSMVAERKRQVLATDTHRGDVGPAQFGMSCIHHLLYYIYECGTLIPISFYVVRS